MQSFFQKFRGQVRYLYDLGYQLARPLIQKVQAKNERFDAYFKRHTRARKWITRIALVTGPPCSVLFLLLFVVWIETPNKRELRNIQNQVASEVYSADSVLLGRYFIQDRTEVKYEEIAPVVIDALISTEDIRFHEHSGVDYRSLGRVLVKSIFLQEESAGGGSTLTQQLAKNLYPRKNYWVLSMLINKLRETRTARRLEKIYSKKDLIALYLNTVPFADNVFGIQAAAKRFYSVPAKDLSIDQAAVLVGMLKATHSYNPRLFPDRALYRRNVVLSQMVKYNALTQEEADTLKQLPLELQYNRVSHHQGLAPYFREFLKAELLEWCERNSKADGSSYNLYTDGLKIYTTINSKLQDYAEKAVADQMAEVQRQFFDHWGRDKPWRGKEYVLEEAIQRSTRYQRLKEQGLSEEEILKQLEIPVPVKLFTWQGEQEVVVSPIDSIIHHLQYLNAGFVVMEPATGQVKAWVGGINHDFFQFDHVKTSTKRQVGSVFKPLVFAMALEKGI
jgi:penicillin-binding protein 1A